MWPVIGAVVRFVCAVSAHVPHVVPGPLVAVAPDSLIAQNVTNPDLQWDQLASELQTSYSELLYGSPGRFDADTAEILWVAIMPEAAKQTLKTIGICRWQPELPEHLLYSPRSISVQPYSSVWRHTPQVAVPSHSWVEVTHCSKVNTLSLYTASLPWFYVARGSGVSINVGVTIVVDLDEHPSCFPINPGSKSEAISALQACLPAFEGGDELDSLQLLKQAEWYSNELRHDIVLLSNDVIVSEETDLLDVVVSQGGGAGAVMCGKEPDLFNCTMMHPGLRSMSNGSCMMPTPPAVRDAMLPTCGRDGKRGLYQDIWFKITTLRNALYFYWGLQNNTEQDWGLSGMLPG